MFCVSSSWDFNTFKPPAQPSGPHCSAGTILCYNWTGLWCSHCNLLKLLKVYTFFFQAHACDISILNSFFPSISLSSPLCPKPAGPECACDIQPNQSTSKHSLAPSTYSNHQTYRQTLFYPRWLHLPRKAQLYFTNFICNIILAFYQTC